MAEHNYYILTYKMLGVECHYAECRYAECRYTECHYTECRGAVHQDPFK